MGADVNKPPAYIVSVRKGAALGHVRAGDSESLRALLERARGDGTEADVLAHIKAREPALAFLRTPAGVGRWGASDWQRRVVMDPSLRILERGGNKTGKTATISWTCSMFMDGAHPTIQRPTGPARLLYVVADLANAYADDVCVGLREFLPESKWHADTKYSELKGFTVHGRRGYKHHNGDTIIFRSGTQDGQAIAGVWSHIVLVNEPPMRSRWGEIMRAAALIAGCVVLVGFTPIDDHGVSRDVLWLRSIVDEAGSEWSEHVVPLTHANAPHRRPEDIDRQIRDMPEWERGQSRDADWEGPAPARRIASFGPDSVMFVDPGQWQMLPGMDDTRELSLGLSADHGELDAKEHWLLYAYQEGGEPIVWVLDEYCSTGETSIETDVDGVLKMLKPWGISLDMVDRWHGDTNSAGKSHLGKINDVFARAFRSATGTQVQILNAMKGPGSVQLGIRVLIQAFSNQRLHINDRASRLKRACNRWDGKSGSEYKDALDTLRYGPGGLLTPTRGNVRRIGRG